MPDSSDKDRRKELLRALKQQEAEAFEAGLPLTREQFEALFDYLDQELDEAECDDTLRHTQDFLEAQGIARFGELRAWLAAHGARCDCEVLANVEEKFED